MSTPSPRATEPPHKAGDSPAPPDSAGGSNGSRFRWWCYAAVFLVALGLRAGWGTIQMSRGTGTGALQFPDEQWYWQMATSFREGRGLVGEFGHRAARMPLYPTLLSLAAGSDHGVVYARIGQWVVGAMAAVFAAMLAVRVAGCAAGLVAGLWVACDPGLVGASSLLLTETLYVTVLAAWWLVGWPLSESNARAHESASDGAYNRAPVAGARYARWALAAGLAATAVYTRPVAIVLVPLWATWVWARRRFEPRALIGAAFVASIVVLSLIPWGLRNQRATGRWCWLTTRAGISLYDGVRPGATGAGDLAGIKDSPAVHGLDEHQWDQYFREQSYQAIRDEPGRIVRLGFVKWCRTWSPFLHADEYQSRAIRAVFGLWSVLFYAAAGWGLAARRREAGLWIGLLLPALMISLVHFFYVGSIRYRVGAVPALAVLAAVGVVRLTGILRRTTRRG